MGHHSATGTAIREQLAVTHTTDHSDLYQDLLHIASVAAQGAVEVIYTNRPSSFQIEQKSSATDHVTEMDLASEDLIRRVIAAHRPEDVVIGEEAQAGPGRQQESGSEVVWFVDPIDGTTNYVYDLPGYAVSIAAQIDGHTVAGLVADPSHSRTYTATRGGGAFCNAEQLQPNRPTDRSSEEFLATALVATGFSYSAERRARQGKVIAELLPKIRDIRRLGSAAVDLCSVAGGRLDAYFEVGLSAWDFAAGSLIATEAGAKVGSLDPGSTETEGILAASPLLFGPLQELLCTLGAAQV